MGDVVETSELTTIGAFDASLLAAIPEDGSSIVHLATDLRLTPGDVQAAAERLHRTGLIELKDGQIVLKQDGRNFVKTMDSSARRRGQWAADVFISSGTDQDLDAALTKLRSEE